MSDAVKAPDKSQVFVVHGRNVQAREDVFSFLRAIGLKPIEWSQATKMTGKGTPFIGEILEAAFKRAQAVVVLLTGDDEARLREHFRKDDDAGFETTLTPQARPNVLFEAGMAFGRYPDRTILVQLGQLRPFSDVAGRHVVHLNNSTQQRQELAQRLTTAGCGVNLTGTDWHNVGDFDAANPSPVENEPGDALEMAVHYIAPNIDHSDYYNNFQVSLEAELAELGTMVTWHFHPRRGASYGTLERVLRHSRPEDVVIFVPKGAFEENKQKLIDVINANPGRALILFDQPAPDEILSSAAVSFVGPDNDLVGTVAAQIMQKLLSDRDDLCSAKFMAIKGPGGQARADGFRDAVKNLFDKEVEMFVFEDADRTKNAGPAAKIVRSLPKDVPVCLFAGNDETVFALLGISEELVEISEPGTRSVCIVGCDATPEMRHKIDPKRLNIATIDTNLAEQAKRIRHIIEEQRWGEHASVSPTAVPPSQRA